MRTKGGEEKKKKKTLRRKEEQLLLIHEINQKKLKNIETTKPKETKNN